jgi:neutral ceramidase
MTMTLDSGAETADITPLNTQFLFGYPHVERYSTGVHDSLMSSALFLSDGATPLLFVTNDVIFVDKALVNRARYRIESATGVTRANILISATHTHSGPITVDYLSNETDAAVPKADAAYLQVLEDGIVAAATLAYRRAQPSEIGFALADGSGVGTNRRDPSGPSDPQVPVLLTRPLGGGDPTACMIICSMHPTVLHEDSTLVSADFPGAFRSYLQAHVLGSDCPVLYHTGPSGNQSPRHVTRANTFAEAARLGGILGKAVSERISDMAFEPHASLLTRRAFIGLPKRAFPSVGDAEATLKRAAEHLDLLRRSGAPPQQTRTAEVDWFGAEETLVLARAAEEGRLEGSYQSCLPAEVQVMGVGPWALVGWPGEVFVEYSLDVKRRHKDAFVISLANGELQGYIVTEGAAREGGYEASNSLFESRSGQALVEATIELIEAF